MVGSWWHSFIGNVLGEPGKMTGWTYEWSNAPSIWKLGYDPTHWEQAADPKVISTTIRDGNFDYLTNQVRWDRAPETLPPSLYLRAKPAFFGSAPWPWVDPTGTTKLGVLPARRRFDEALGTTTSAPAPGPGSPDKGNPDKGNPDKGNPGKGNPGKGNAG